jgi:hypothetical protein
MHKAVKKEEFYLNVAIQMWVAQVTVCRGIFQDDVSPASK